jgi:hypothetical protein
VDDQPLDEDVEWEPVPPAPSTERLPPWRVDPAARYDALWRKQPQVPGFMQFARAIPGYAAQFHGRVPENFVVEVDHGLFAVKCPCEETPLLRRNIPQECPCGRVYCHVGGGVRVAYTGAAVAP